MILWTKQKKGEHGIEMEEAMKLKDELGKLHDDSQNERKNEYLYSTLPNVLRRMAKEGKTYAQITEETLTKFGATIYDLFKWCNENELAYYLKTGLFWDERTVVIYWK